MQYAIYEGNLDRLRAKLTRIENKCRKYGCEFSYKEVGEEFREVKRNDGEKCTARFVLVDVIGTAKVNDWEFVASIDHTEKGNIFHKTCDLEIPARYYDAEPACEHCHVKRYRTNTYIVHNTKTGEFKQVGKSCLKDFTHGMSAEMATEYLSFFDTLATGEEPYQGGRIEHYLNTRCFLQYAAETIRHFGYIKPDDYMTRSTKEQALLFYNLDHGHLSNWYSERVQAEKDHFGIDPESEEAVKMTVDALAWLDTQEANNNYMHNLKTACSLEYTKANNAGILVSLFPTFNKALEKKKKEKAEDENPSQFVGQVGDRVEIPVDNYEVVTSWETKYGLQSLYKITSGNNVFIWKTSCSIPDNTKKLKGTVKEHKVFNGVNQTELTRCKILEA